MAAAKKAMREVNSDLFSIPTRSPDINPIENFFNLVRRRLEKVATTMEITKDTYDEFESRVNWTMSDLPLSSINKQLNQCRTDYKEL